MDSDRSHALSPGLYCLICACTGHYHTCSCTADLAVWIAHAHANHSLILTLEDLARRHQLLLQDPVIAVQSSQQRLQPEDDLREGEHLPPQSGLTLDPPSGMATPLKPAASGETETNRRNEHPFAY